MLSLLFQRGNLGPGHMFNLSKMTGELGVALRSALTLLRGQGLGAQLPYNAADVLMTQQTHPVSHQRMRAQQRPRWLAQPVTPQTLQQVAVSPPPSKHLKKSRTRNRASTSPWDSHISTVRQNATHSTDGETKTQRHKELTVLKACK